MLLTESLKAFEKYMVYKNWSKETVRCYKSDLRMFNRFMIERKNSLVYLDDIATDDVEEYMYFLVDDRELTPNSQNRYLYSLRSFYNYAMKKQWVDRSAAADVDPVKVVEGKKVVLNQEEIEELLGAIDHQIIRFAVNLMAHSGMRVFEARGLILDDIEFEKNRFYVNGKGKRQRYIPIAKSLKPHLDEYLNNIRGDVDSEFVLATTKSGTISAFYINNILHKATKKLGWDKKVTCHTLRRSFATNLLRNGVNVFAIQNLLGHESLKTTQVYLQINDNELQTAVDTL